ncbi:MAG: IclR family transcriptional regulator [Lachnospiraceae bacterium]|jgi:DNA-binding IclR family transcriptional regulator|nr:IclR family transcriptional regulator [Lachnospiraceae bacterium]
MPHTDAAGNQSSDKLLKLIEYLATQGEPLRLIDIAKALGMHSSTALRFLTTLARSGYVAQDTATSKYYLTYKLCALGLQVRNHRQLPTTAAPYIEEIARTVGETACLAISQNDQVVYIDVAVAPGQIVKAMQRIGNIAPMHCTGIGKVLLSRQTDDEVLDFAARAGLPRFTDKTITTSWGLKQELDTVRGQGYAIDDEECELGSRCIALPIFDYSGKAIAGFSVTGPSLRINDAFMKKWLPYLRGMSTELSRLMGHEPA